MEGAAAQPAQVAEAAEDLRSSPVRVSHNTFPGHNPISVLGDDRLECVDVAGRERVVQVLDDDCVTSNGPSLA